MEITLSDKQISQIASKTAMLVVNRLKTVTETEPVLVNVREAARILGISADHMRKIKDEYPHVRHGGSQQGHIYFIRESLLSSLPGTMTKK